MARLTNGINGPVTGKVGSVIASSRNGVAYIKGKHKKRTKKVSAKELKNRERFAVAQAWLKPLLHFVRESYKHYSVTSYGFIAAKSYLLKNAIVSDDAGFHVLPEMMQVSHGDLPLPKNLKFEHTGERELNFTWDTVSAGTEYADDQAMLLAYNVADQVAYFTLTGQFRKTGKDVLEFDAQLGKSYEIYVAFSAADRSLNSASVHLGTLKLP